MNLALFVWTLSDAVGLIVLTTVMLIYISFAIKDFFTRP